MKYHLIHRANTGMHCFYIQPLLLKGLETEKRVICNIDKLSFHCALMKNKLGNHYIYISKDKMKKLSLAEGMTVNPTFSQDKSRHQFEFPQEFKAVLKTDPEAEAIFKKLTGGGQRALLYLIQRMKTIEKRIEKSLMIAENLKKGITSPRSQQRQSR